MQINSAVGRETNFEVELQFKGIVKTNKQLFNNQPPKSSTPGHKTVGNDKALVKVKVDVSEFDPYSKQNNTKAETTRIGGRNQDFGNGNKHHLMSSSHSTPSSESAKNYGTHSSQKPISSSNRNQEHGYKAQNPIQGIFTGQNHTPQNVISQIQSKNLHAPNNGQQAKLGPPELSKISQDLASKIGNNPNTTSAPFFHPLNINKFNSQSSYTAQHDNGWNSTMHVRTVFSSKNVIRGATQQRIICKWDIIHQWLTSLAYHCKTAKPTQPVDLLMRTTILYYDPDVQTKTDFLNLTNQDVASCMTSTIPHIVVHALKLPSLLAGPVPFLKKHQNNTIYLTKKLVCSLLANAFFCTLPEEKQGMQTINFHTMFNTASKGNAKAEKLKCILNYFQQMSKQVQVTGDRIISFERRYISIKVDWTKSFKSLTKVDVEQKKKIEDAQGMLKIDFANKRVGGGVMNEGAVMEEILFAACPELLISRLFTEPLEDDEVLIITGSEQFSEYSGYSRSFSYAGPAKGKKVETDKLNRVYTPIVVMDALHFKDHEKESQFQKGPIDRELHKAFVAFIQNDGVNIPIATGNWGCGAFNGDPELKFLIQWMAASETGSSLVYHTIGDAKQSQSIQAMVKFLVLKNVKVGDLYKAVLSYQKKRSRNPSVFDYVKSVFSSKF
ncbi:Poly(ADP-ribose) glycohydrolase [Orchesella cincta]|uniref:poly(ADP-ribose) glycohydrolase n=1 Tax=Orchesella cincta TaxID=48709 RepID=A0A1D2M6T0_ORCCI|nr:Poly(ADP-ribose) glycohydrolase [Orchesella cincta]